MSNSKPLDRKEAVKRIDNFIAEHDDWRGDCLQRGAQGQEKQGLARHLAAIMTWFLHHRGH